jgi:pilus assembly protein CpaC
MMNEHENIHKGSGMKNSRLWQHGGKLFAVALGAALVVGAPLQAAEPAKAPKAAKATRATKAAPRPTTSQTLPAVGSGAESSPPLVNVALRKSTLLKLPSIAYKIKIVDPAVIDVVLLGPTEISLIGKQVGATQLILSDKSGKSTVVDVVVSMESGAASALQTKLRQLLPGETGIKVEVASDSLVLTGTVTDAVKVDKAVALAEAYGGKKVINFLQTAAPQQVMLEVKVAEVSKSLLDKLGAGVSMTRTNGNWTYNILSSFLNGSSGVLSAAKDAKHSVTLDAEKKDGLIKILAEPTIMAMSGQEGSFLAGGKIYIPVAQSGAIGGVSSITLEEKEFGVGLKFTPTVLEGGRINLKVAPEVSELSATGTTITSTPSSGGDISSVLPSINTRRASTTVQLNDGQSLAIGGLIKNNVTETIKAFPMLGEIPVLGALFRSSNFQSDRTELVFIITPRLIKPLPPDYALPTDGFVEPTRSEFFIEGKLEGGPKAPQAAESAPKAATEPKNPPAADGFQMK